MIVMESERPVCTRPHLWPDWTGTPPPRLMLGSPLATRHLQTVHTTDNNERNYNNSLYTPTI